VQKPWPIASEILDDTSRNIHVDDAVPTKMIMQRGRIIRDASGNIISAEIVEEADQSMSTQETPWGDPFDSGNEICADTSSTSQNPILQCEWRLEKLHHSKVERIF
jgi:hypothetical protein